MSWGKYTTTISLVTFIAAVFFLYSKGLNLGVDFTGGTVLEVGYSQPADINKIRSTLLKLALPDATVQNFGTSRDVLIRLPAKPDLSSAKLSETVIAALKQENTGCGDKTSGVCRSAGRSGADRKRSFGVIDRFAWYHCIPCGAIRMEVRRFWGHREPA